MLDLTKQPIIYVTRDLERALGLPVNTKGYFIISNFSDFAKSYQKHKNVLLIKEKKILDTWELLQNKQVKKFINNIANIPLNPPFLRGKLDTSPLCKGGPGGILVFKNTLQIEKTCAENNWKLLNPPARISNEVEEKISQITWLGPLKKYLPKYKVLKCKEIAWGKLTLAQRSGVGPFILQFNRSHTGSGTTLIESKKQLQTLQQKFPEREVRIAEYIPGPLFTNNNVVANSEIMVGNINYQITGLKPFTDLPFSTIGNDWALPHKILNKKQIAQYKKIATDVGLRLKKAGWRGLFGIDIVMHEKTGKLYLLEINCRQPASTTYESQLQRSVIPTECKRVEGSLKQCKRDSSTSLGMTTFEAHLLALLNMNLENQTLIKIQDGAQIIQRMNDEQMIKKLNNYKIIEKLKKNNFNTIQYNNTKLNSDLIRIQSKTGIMKKHNEFSIIGNKIVNLLKIK